MRTGVSYMGHHNPKHLRSDLKEIKELGCDDVLLAAQENDFAHFVGKLKHTPPIAKELGLRPIAIFWGVLNLLGGGKSSQFLLEHQEGFQVNADGTRRPAGCYMNLACRSRIKEMIDEIAELGFQGYFIDEPKRLTCCFCPACRTKFEEWYEAGLADANPALQDEFRLRGVIDYVKDIAGYCKANHPGLETICCLMPGERSIWKEVGELESLDNLGTDIYLVNADVDVEEMTPLVRELEAICRATGKRHHEWLQSQRVQRGREERITRQGQILLRERPDALYVWAWQAQLGMDEESEDPERAWAAAAGILRKAKE